MKTLSDLFAPIVKTLAPRLPGIRFVVEDIHDANSPSLYRRIDAVIGDEVGRDLVLWSTRIDIERIRDTCAHDEHKATEAIMRPVRALVDVVRNAERVAFEKGKAEGIAEGKKAALEPFRAVADLFKGVLR